MASCTMTNVQPHTNVTPTRRSVYKILMLYPHFRAGEMLVYVSTQRKSLEDERGARDHAGVPYERRPDIVPRARRRPRGPDSPATRLPAQPPDVVASGRGLRR